MPHNQNQNENQSRPIPPVNRHRRELITSLVLAGGAALLSGIPLGIYVVAPAIGKSIDKWIDLGHVKNLPEDGFDMFSYEFLIKDGWLVIPQRGFVWARMAPNRNIKVFSSTCSHLACNVIWQRETRTFECPCHSGKFDVEGQPVAGPPTRPLKELDYRVEADVLKVHMTI